MLRVRYQRLLSYIEAVLAEKKTQNSPGVPIMSTLVGAAKKLIFASRPIPQPASYHNFADRRAFLGIPNFMDVISNLPMLLVGVWGLRIVAKLMSKGLFLNGSEGWAYAVFFLGVALTSFGSSYYHLHPTNARLVWDRLPMTLGFMGILAATIAERIGARAAAMWLPVLVVAGALSVIYWYWSETRGWGDLRPYHFVQFGSLLAVFVILTLFPARHTQTSYLFLALGLYVAAKLLESFDPDIYSLGNVVSGHTLKHLAAAASTYFVLLMLKH